MLPCQPNCSAYACGCHKTCEHWRLYQEEQRAQRQAKKRYLEFYNTRCAQMTHQYRAMEARRPAW